MTEPTIEELLDEYDGQVNNCTLAQVACDDPERGDENFSKAELDEMHAKELATRQAILSRFKEKDHQIEVLTRKCGEAGVQIEGLVDRVEELERRLEPSGDFRKLLEGLFAGARGYQLSRFPTPTDQKLLDHEAALRAEIERLKKVFKVIADHLKGSEAEALLANLIATDKERR